MQQEDIEFNQLLTIIDRDPKKLREDDLRGYHGETLFRAYCHYASRDILLPFDAFSNNGMIFVIKYWEVLDDYDRDNIVIQSWRRDIEIPKEVKIDYTKLIDYCDSKRTGEKLFAEIMNKGHHGLIRWMADKAMHNNYYNDLLAKCIEAELLMYTLPCDFWSLSLGAAKYFVEVHKMKPSKYDIQKIMDYFDFDLMKYFLRVFGSAMFVDLTKNDDDIFDEFKGLTKRSQRKFSKMFIKCGYWDIRMKECMEDLIGFCADHYIPGLEKICPDCLPLIAARKKIKDQ